MQCIEKGENIPIDGFVVSLRGDYFRSEIVGGSAQGPGNIGDILGKAEICNLQVTMTVQQ